YFDDPEGNGVELYVDRPRESWQRDANGLLQTATNPLDPNAFLRANLAAPSSGSAGPPATLGHVHLQVGDIGAARDFYVDALGFEVMSDLGSALFIAAGGYHHHIAVPDDDDVAALRQRLTDHGVGVRHDGAVLRFDDPWGTLIQVEATGA